MHAIVLYHGGPGCTETLARAVAGELDARAVSFDRRPDLTLYDLVVLALPVTAVLDPRLPAFAATEVRGKTLALLTDAGPLGEPLFWGLGAAALVGGARMFAPQLHVSTGWLADTRDLAARQAHEWARLLASAFPTPSYPRGPAGKRTTR